MLGRSKPKRKTPPKKAFGSLEHLSTKQYKRGFDQQCEGVEAAGFWRLNDFPFCFSADVNTGSLMDQERFMPTYMAAWRVQQGMIQVLMRHPIGRIKKWKPCHLVQFQLQNQASEAFWRYHQHSGSQTPHIFPNHPTKIWQTTPRKVFFVSTLNKKDQQKPSISHLNISGELAKPRNYPFVKSEPQAGYREILFGKNKTDFRQMIRHPMVFFIKYSFGCSLGYCLPWVNEAHWPDNAS